MKIGTYASVSLLLFASAVARQIPTTGSNLGGISGIVVTSDGRGVPRARITLRTATANDEDTTLVADEKGRFGFAHINPGSYFLLARKTGYAAPSAPSAGYAVQVIAGETVQDVSLKLIRLGAITGRVVGENGDPIEAKVSAFRYVPAGSVAGSGKTTDRMSENGSRNIEGDASGKVGFQQAGEAASDDRGEFRIHSLRPGRYYLRVDALYSRHGESAIPNRGRTYPSEFYPQAPPLDALSALPVAEGEERRVDFTMHSVPPPVPVVQPGTVAARNPASLSGRVVSSEGHPLAGAAVKLGWGSTDLMSTADEDGRFGFANLGPTLCVVSAQKPGYVNRANDAATPRLSAGEHLEGVMLTLYRAAAITGSLLDENGGPRVGAEVSAWAQDSSGKLIGDGMLRGATTDDHGEFRIHSLPPAQYVVMAAAAGDDLAGNSYPPVFYPGTPLFQGAVALTVRPGDEVSLRLLMPPVRGASIRGQVRGGNSSGYSVTIERDESGPFLPNSSRAAVVRPDGSFEVRNVLPGKYTVKAVAQPTVAGAPPREGHTDIEVAQEDVHGIVIALAEAPQIVTVSGTVRCECPPGATMRFGSILLHPVPAPKGTRTAESPMARYARDLKFTLKIPAGKWRIYSTSFRFASASEDNAAAYLKSASLGDVDVTNSEFTVTRGTAATQLELLFSGFAPRIDGIVLDSDDKPVANADVIGIPENGLSDPELSARMLTAQTSPKGEFSIRGHPPGEYTLFAYTLDKQPSTEFDAFLRELASHGQVLKTEEKQGYKVILHLTSLKEQ